MLSIQTEPELVLDQTRVVKATYVAVVVRARTFQFSRAHRFPIRRACAVLYRARLSVFYNPGSDVTLC